MAKALQHALIGGVLAAIAVALVVPALQKGGVSPRVYCKNNMKALGLALHQYNERWKCFPPAYVLGPDGRRWHSWRVYLLPYLDSQKLHRQYRFDEPWDSDHNRQLWNQCPPFFRCPTGPLQTTATNYVAVVGPRTMWSGQDSVKLSQCKDGSANTILLVEISPGVPWLAPVDVTEEEALADLGVHGRFGIPKHASNRHVLRVDGAVQGLTAENSNPQTFWAMLTRNGREPIVNPF